MSAHRPRVTTRLRGAATVAVATDLIFGEPPTAIHPTALMGRGIRAGRQRYHQRRAGGSTAEALAMGAVVAVVGVGISAIASGAASLLVRSAIGAASTQQLALQAAAEGLLLKPALSVRALLEAARSVERALERRDLDEARRLLSWHLVSRDTSTLDEGEIAGAVVASLAENLSDSIVAPLLAYRVGGIPAAYGYRFANTADAMLGYRTADLEWFGKPAARLDDLLNLAPSRLTAVLIALVAPAGGGSARDAWRCARVDARRTPSPNGGWPMAAMAGALGVRLEKHGTYVLGGNERAPRPTDIARARRIVVAATLLATAAVELS